MVDKNSDEVCCCEASKTIQTMLFHCGRSSQGRCRQSSAPLVKHTLFFTKELNTGVQADQYLLHLSSTKGVMFPRMSCSLENSIMFYYELTLDLLKVSFIKKVQSKCLVNSTQK